MLFSRPFNAAIGLCCLTLAACVTTPMPIRHQAPDYSAQAPLRLDVTEIMVLNDASTTPLTAELGQKFGHTPEDAMREWAAKRIQAAGTQGSFTVILKDANVVAAKLPVKSGLKSYFNRQQAVRWDAYLNVMIAVEGSSQMLPPAEITINARTSQTLPEDASEEEKRQTYHSILNKLMSSFDAEAKKQMDTYFRAYYL